MVCFRESKVMATVLGLLLALLLIFLPLATAAVAEINQVGCDYKSEKCDTYSALSLIEDLKAKVPGDPWMEYCNVVTSEWSGRQVFGYAYCNTKGRSDDPPAACLECLTVAGKALIDGCRFQTGSAGDVWGPASWCYIKIGTFANCPH